MISISPAVLNPEDSNNFSSFPSLISISQWTTNNNLWSTGELEIRLVYQKLLLSYLYYLSKSYLVMLCRIKNTNKHNFDWTIIEKNRFCSDQFILSLSELCKYDWSRPNLPLVIGSNAKSLCAKSPRGSSTTTDLIAGQINKIISDKKLGETRSKSLWLLLYQILLKQTINAVKIQE